MWLIKPAGSLWRTGLAALLCLMAIAGTVRAQEQQDPVAERMLVYQRSIGGWPKAVHLVPVDYRVSLSAADSRRIAADSLAADATIDNNATSREIRYLVKAFGLTGNRRYLQAAEKGINYLFRAQYANGGWPQYYPEHSLYRAEITYNDNAMVNVLNILMDVCEGINGFDQLNTEIRPRAAAALQLGISCILKTQVRVNGRLTVWCAQYNERTLQPAKARAFELVSLSGMESVGITAFLMRIKNPPAEIREAVQAAVSWFESVKITGYAFIQVAAPSLPGGKDKMLVKKDGAVIWARFYDIDTNQAFFTGRDGIRKNTLAEIELERRTGYAWYGTWPADLLYKKYPEWLKKTMIKNDS